MHTHTQPRSCYSRLYSARQLTDVRIVKKKYFIQKENNNYNNAENAKIKKNTKLRTKYKERIKFKIPNTKYKTHVINPKNLHQ